MTTDTPTPGSSAASFVQGDVATITATGDQAGGTFEWIGTDNPAIHTNVATFTATAADVVVDRTDTGINNSIDALSGGRVLATQVVTPYRTWITPTVQFPESSLQALTPKWGDKPAQP